MVDTDDTRRTTDDGRRTTPRVWHKLPTGELKNMPPKKKLSRGCLSNWCDADADAEISKTICRPPPYGGVDIIIAYGHAKNSIVVY